MPTESNQGKAADVEGYTTLRILGRVISWIGWIVAILGLIGGFATQVFGMSTTYALSSIPGFIMGIVIVAQGQAVSCFVDIYRNTERIARNN